MARALDVFLHGDSVGRLVQDDSGRLSFTYASAWVESCGAPLSLSLPVRTESFEHRSSEPFFGGLLPEEGVRERVARYLGVTARNDFALLERIGGECAGAVALFPEGEAPPSSEADAPLAPLGDERLAQLLDELPRRPLLVAGEVRLSLAGAQDKAAVSLVDGRIALPAGSTPTTHILKTPIAGYESTVSNELLCMRTAARLGLAAARAERRVVLGREFLLVERFDRDGAGGRVARVHQEDFCQALGVPTRTKYQSEGGPRLSDCFSLLTRHAQRPALDRLALLRATIFNVLVGNADAHAKNFSLAHGPGFVALTPLYDVLSTLCYEGLSLRYAMKIGTSATFDEIRREDWNRFAVDAGLAPAQVRRELSEMCARLPRAMAEELEAGAYEADGGPLLTRIVEETAERCGAMEGRI
ncbi:MAG: type II toxin-antitoxin system HipA family toxin [Planctomycetota bacterium]